MIKKIVIIVFCLVLFWGEVQAKVKPVEVQRQEWNEWLETLKNEMIEKGISRKTIEKAYDKDYFHEVKKVALQDKKQALKQVRHQ